MNKKIKTAAVIAFGMAFMLVLGKMAGANKGLEENNAILMSIVCSLDSEQLTDIINSMQESPAEFKEMFPEQHREAWIEYKLNLLEDCISN
jgi:hypothetical protein